MNAANDVGTGPDVVVEVTTPTGLFRVTAKLDISFNIPLSFSLAPTVVPRLNDSVIADPQFTVAIPDSDGHSLCYEVHGEADNYFNLISDTCASVNAYYTAMPLDSRRNRMSKIGVRASSGGPERCVEVEVDLESCAARVGGREVNGSVAIGQVRVSRVRMNLWRVAVPNCGRPGLVMWVTCMTNRLRFDVNRGSTIRSSSHGLLGRCPH